MSKAEYERAERFRQRKKKRKQARDERKDRVEQKHIALKQERMDDLPLNYSGKSTRY